MFTLISNSAKSSIIYINDHVNSRIQFTRYEVGLLASSLVIDRRNQLANTMRDPNAIFIADSFINSFSSKYSGAASDMTCSLMDETKFALKLAVPADDPYFKFNAVVVYAKRDNGPEFPFLLSYSMDINPKLSTTYNRFGMRYFYMVQMELRLRDQRLDLSNLEHEVPDFLQIQEAQLPKASEMKQDQAIVSNHQMVPNGYKVFAVESLGQTWGVLAQPWTYDGYEEKLVVDGEQVTLDNEEIIIATRPDKGYTVIVNGIEPPLPWGSPATYMFLMMGL